MSQRGLGNLVNPYFMFREATASTPRGIYAVHERGMSLFVDGGTASPTLLVSMADVLGDSYHDRGLPRVPSADAESSCDGCG